METCFTFIHINFQVIAANVTNAGKKPFLLEDITEFPLKIQFTYSTFWKETKYAIFLINFGFMMLKENKSQLK